MIQACPNCRKETDVSGRIAGDIIWCSCCDARWIVRFDAVIKDDGEETDEDDFEFE